MFYQRAFLILDVTSGLVTAAFAPYTPRLLDFGRGPMAGVAGGGAGSSLTDSPFRTKIRQ